MSDLANYHKYFVNVYIKTLVQMPSLSLWAFTWASLCLVDSRAKTIEQKQQRFSAKNQRENGNQQKNQKCDAVFWPADHSGHRSAATESPSGTPVAAVRSLFVSDFDQTAVRGGNLTALHSLTFGGEE